MDKQEILITAIAFRPNVGGVETHLDDLVKALIKRDWYCHVLTYAPITSETKVNFLEVGDGYSVYRIPWFRNLFYKLVHNPIMEFLYLLPGLFSILPILLLTKARNVKTIHSHGLIAGFVSVFWGRIFDKRVITTTHSIYNFPKSGLYKLFSKWIFTNSDHVLCLSQQSVNEIISLGIESKHVSKFTYWIDLNKFKPAVKKNKDFVVLFVGRLVPEKGIKELIEASKMWNSKIKLQVIGDGPLKNIIPCHQYVGKVRQEDLPRYYQQASVTIVPSVHEEGFGRVILESLACGTPVIGSNRGAIPEAMNDSVGELITISPKDIAVTVNSFYSNPKLVMSLSKNATTFTRLRYSVKNVEKIIVSY